MPLLLIKLKMTERDRQLLNILQRYMPEKAAEWALGKIKHHRIQLRITGYRRSKLGDYRPSDKGQFHRISINYHLNPQAFTVTFVHEVAHLETYLGWGSPVAPHGPEWHTVFARLMCEVLKLKALHPTVENYFRIHGFRHAASACSDPQLTRLLRTFDQVSDPEIMLLEQVPAQGFFIMPGGRVFRKGPLQRTRYKCICMHTGQSFLIHHLMEVKWCPSGNPLQSKPMK